MKIDKKRLVKKREKEKKKIPNFCRPESWRYKRLKNNWRRPRGLDSKVRLKVKGWPASPKIGYRGPRISRGLHPSSYREIRVFNIDDLNSVDPETEAIMISSKIGKKKRIEVINKAQELKIRVLNPREYKELEIPITEKKNTK